MAMFIWRFISVSGYQVQLISESSRGVTETPAISSGCKR
jgi:hypothetical protein